MKTSKRVEDKLVEAKQVLVGCMGKKGLWASPYRYKDQCWTRDFVYGGEEYLIGAGQVDLAKRHIENLAARQLPDGRIPIMFLDNQPRWLLGKIGISIKNRRMSFLLRRYFSRDGIGWLSPWTRDSELLFALGVATYSKLTGDSDLLARYERQVDDAINYVKRSLMNRDGLVRGVDWRDTRPDLDDAYLLTNNCWLYRAFVFLEREEEAQALAEKIDERFWNGSHYRDYVGSSEPRTGPDEFDTLGNALTILTGIATAERAESILHEAERLTSGFGYRLNIVTLPPKDKREADLMAWVNQVGVIWPFIHGYMTLAALEVGQRDLAERGLAQWSRLPGFYEWYDPETGEGHGSPDQMWSAALYIRVVAALYGAKP